MTTNGHRGGHRFGIDGGLCERGCGKTSETVHAERVARTAKPEIDETVKFARERRRADLGSIRNERRRLGIGK